METCLALTANLMYMNCKCVHLLQSWVHVVQEHCCCNADARGPVGRPRRPQLTHSSAEDVSDRAICLDVCAGVNEQPATHPPRPSRCNMLVPILVVVRIDSISVDPVDPVPADLWGLDSRLTRLVRADSVQ